MVLWCLIFFIRIRRINSFIRYAFNFKDLVNNFFNIKDLDVVFNILKFEHGCFSLLHNYLKNLPVGIDFFIDFSDSSDRNGGFIRYIDNKKVVLEIVTVPNSISFVRRSRNMLKYFKYVNHKQLKPIILVSGTIFKK